ncbi:hypothetical protein LguiA_034250 [Lonicera macranthoides]
MPHYYYSSSSSSSSSATLPVLAPQPSYSSDSDASAAASSRVPVAWQSRVILASDPPIQFYLGASHHGAPDDNPSLALTLYENPWKIEKELTRTDVNGSAGRLLLSRKAVEEHVLSSMGEEDAQQCRTREGKEFVVWDADDSSEHRLFLKKWDSNEYFVLTGKWKRNFVNRKGLKGGDKIGLAWHGAQFYFKLLNRN